MSTCIREPGTSLPGPLALVYMYMRCHSTATSNLQLQPHQRPKRANGFTVGVTPCQERREHSQTVRFCMPYLVSSDDADVRVRALGDTVT